MQDLVDILKELKSYQDFIKPSDDAILEAGARIFSANNIVSGKKADFGSSQEKASEQQIWRLKKEGFKGNFEEITKLEASQAISDIEVKKIREAQNGTK